MRSLWEASIWHPDAIPSHEKKYASPLKRVIFPVYNAAVIALGGYGLGTGFKAVREAFPTPVPEAIYLLLIVCGIACMIGCAFPGLWPMEITGKFMVFVILGIVLAAMMSAGVFIPGHTGLVVAPVLVVMMLPPSLRLWILGVEWSERRAD